MSNHNTTLVATPAGTLIAAACGDTEYPGICISLIREDGEKITLALVEHVPGGECVEHNRDTGLIPDTRVTGADNLFLPRLTTGLMSRVWVDESNDSETFVTVAHDGYASVANTEDGHQDSE